MPKVEQQKTPRGYSRREFLGWLAAMVGSGLILGKLSVKAA
jgi:hypothetical protein